MSLENKTKVYTLLIGINDYNETIDLTGKGGFFSKLHACLKDTKSVLKYLEKDTTINLMEPKFLWDNEATKTAVVNAFRKDLAKAQEEDSILIYYSGHGTAEYADEEVWKDESDGRLEALVCYYENEHSPDFLLTSKELRFLIHELYQKTKAHIVTIFDCCHSGDNTRSASMGGAIPKKIGYVFKKRKWEEFIFANNYKADEFSEPLSDGFTREDFLNGSIPALLPQGAHIQLAAAESDEEALEFNGKGLFTSFLLKALKSSNGNLSYQDLQTSVRNKMRGIYQQKPKVYTPNEFEFLLQSGFLNRKTELIQGGKIVFNANRGDHIWVLNRGFLNGVKEDFSEVIVDLDGEELIGKVRSTTLDSAEVKFEDADLLNFRKDYPVKITGIYQKAIKLRLVNKNVRRKDIEAILDQLASLENDGLLSYENNPQLAYYDLVFWNDLVYLSLPEDHFRPLIDPFYTWEKNILPNLESYLHHISQWTYLRLLKNEAKNKLPQEDLQITFEFIDLEDNAKPLSIDSNNTISSTLLREYPGEMGGRLRITVKNTSKNNLYVAAVYLGNDFSAQTGLLEPTVSMLEPEKSIIIREINNGIPINLDEKIFWYNWEKDNSWIQFVYSTEDFSANQLQIGGLLLPLDPSKDISRSEKRGLNIDSKGTTTQLKGWTTQTFKLSFINPSYNKWNRQKALPFIEYDDQYRAKKINTYLGHFISGLYLEQLDFVKSGVLNIDEDNYKEGLAWPLGKKEANIWTQYWRTKRFKDMVEEFPNAPRLAAIGDSWFQHPSCTDIIDNLACFFPTYSLATTEENILAFAKQEAVLEQLKSSGASSLLLSTGGNTLLFKALENTLADQAGESSDPASFFTEQLDEVFSTLKQDFEAFFSYYKAQLPNLSLIIHGYDYVNVYPAGADKRSSLGQLLDAKGIEAEEARRAIIHYLIDKFNKLLESVCKDQKNAHYLDLRGTIKAHQWSDEIHPTDEAFQHLSWKIIMQLNTLIVSSERQYCR